MHRENVGRRGKTRSDGFCPRLTGPYALGLDISGSFSFRPYIGGRTAAAAHRPKTMTSIRAFLLRRGARVKKLGPQLE